MCRPIFQNFQIQRFEFFYLFKAVDCDTWYARILYYMYVYDIVLIVLGVPHSESASRSEAKMSRFECSSISTIISLYHTANSTMSFLWHLEIIDDLWKLLCSWISSISLHVFLQYYNLLSKFLTNTYILIQYWNNKRNVHNNVLKRYTSQLLFLSKNCVLFTYKFVTISFWWNCYRTLCINHERLSWTFLNFLVFVRS